MSLFSGPKEIILSIKEEPFDLVDETEHILNRKLSLSHKKYDILKKRILKIIIVFFVQRSLSVLFLNIFSTAVPSNSSLSCERIPFIYSFCFGF